MIVLDASAVLEFLLGTGAGARVVARIGASDTVHAPHLLDVEIVQVLRRLVRGRELPRQRAEQALAALSGFRVLRHAHYGFVARVWDLRDKLSAYDAVYVALAEALHAPLLTLDARLARAGGHEAAIELIA